MFAQPEFAEHQLIFQLTKVIDHFDKVIFDIMKKNEHDIDILLGSNNPFSADCSSVLGRIQTSLGAGIIGIIAPLRADYQYMYSLIKSSRILINSQK